MWNNKCRFRFIFVLICVIVISIMTQCDANAKKGSSYHILKSTTEYRNMRHVVYHHNYDGDTITFNIAGYPDIIGKEIPIRVRGVDTPEIRGQCLNEKLLAIKVKRFVESEMIRAKRIMILNPDRDKYFRILGDVSYDKKDLGTLLLEKGYAVPYDGGTKTNPWCD